MRFGRRATWGAVGLALGLFAGGMAVLAVPKTSPLPPDFMGHPAMAPVSLGGPTFEVRHNCRIARFGVAPWQPKGAPKDARWEQMTRLWLQSIGMPLAGHDGAIAALRAPAGPEVDVRNTTGSFDTTYRVGDRYVSCLQSQTRFGSDEQIEPAWSRPYTYGGRTWHLAIIQRCGNVTLLPAPVVPPVIVPPAAGVGPALPPGLGGVPPIGGVPPVVTYPGGGGLSPAPFPLPGGPVHEVPEPGVLGLMLAALGALLFGRHRKGAAAAANTPTPGDAK